MPSSDSYTGLSEWLDDWKQCVPPPFQWDENGESKNKNINIARLHGKYYGARYIINRPYLFTALKQRSKGDGKEFSHDSVIMRAAKRCVNAAIKSTEVFDTVGEGLNDRLIVTNIFGTAHA
jgi:hypothetical protein